MSASGYVAALLSQATTNIETVPNLFFYNDQAGANGFPAGATSGDTIGTITGTNYFSDGQKRGLRLGSRVDVITDAGGAGIIVYPCYVAAVQASPGLGATLAQCQAATTARTVTGTTDTLLATDNGGVVYYTSASAVTLTIPAGLGAGFEVGIIQGGAGQVTPTAGPGVTGPLSRQGFTKTAGQDAVIGLTAPIADTFYLSGDGA